MTNPEDPLHPTAERELADALRSTSWPVPRRAGRCPDEAQIAGFVDGGLAGPPRQRVAGHLAGCEHCFGLAATLLQLRGGEALDVPPDLRRSALQLSPKTRARGWNPFRWKVVAPAAAGLILAVGVGIWLGSGLPPAPSGRQDPALHESGSVRLQLQGHQQPRILAPQEGKTIDPQRTPLRWTAAPDAIFYEVQLLSDDGDLLWQGRTEGVEMRLPDDAGLVPGREYFLWVRAYLPDGTTAKSTVVGFDVMRGQQGSVAGEDR